MAYYFCIAEGMADCTPTTQDFYYMETTAGVRYAIREACASFERLEADAGNGRPYRHAFRMPRKGENNWSQRLRISRGADCVLDVIGMTRDEYLRETGEGEDRAEDGGTF